MKVRLYDGRVVVGTFCGIEETVAGKKVRIISGDCLLTVNADQVDPADLALAETLLRVARVSKRDIEKKKQ